MEGLLLPSELAEIAASYGMSALGLADHHLLSGAVEFVLACKKAGIYPILGLEIDLAWENSAVKVHPREERLTLLAYEMAGWSSLCELSSDLQLGNRTAGQGALCPLDLLAIRSKGLLAIAPSQNDPSGVRLNRLKELFPSSLYLAIDDPDRATILTSLSHQLNLPVVVVPPVYYRTADQESLQRTVSAIRLNTTIRNLPNDAVAPAGAVIPSLSMLTERYSQFPFALAATDEVADRCRFELPLGVAHMPQISLPPGQTVAQLLRQKAEIGAVKKYGALTDTIRARLDHELSVISSLGYEPIFLIVEELLSFARRAGIPFSSRGSAASSLVASCLGITSPDPLRLDLYFERFLNPSRTTPPDIDTDLCSRRRDEVIHHAFEIFGSDRVAMVATINHYRPRSAVSDVAKAYGLSPVAAQQLSAQLPYGFFARREEEGEGENPSPLAEIRTRYPDTLHQHIFDDADALLKLPRHLSVHPGGLVVAPGRMTDLVPVMRSGTKGINVAQFDHSSIEALGLVKIDLLGIRGLTVLGDVAEFVRESLPDRFSSSLAVLEATPNSDIATSNSLERGQTIGCFQIESPGMRATLREIRARNEDDLMVALALYRPGPLQGGLRDTFVRRFKGEETVVHLHPSLEPLLRDTYGVILYQEQVLRIAHALAGFSLAEADLLRRAMSHFDPGRQMQNLRDKFIAAAEAKSGVPPDTGQRVWELMAAFAGYGFPKAHAASYAQVAWRSAWCKVHFPAEFMAAVLANGGGYYNQSVYLSEARRQGLTIRPPHVNFSGEAFKVVRNIASKYPGQPETILFMGLGQVRDLTRRTIARIMAFRPFKSLDDFLVRVDPRMAEVNNLIRVGAFEGMGVIPSLLRHIQQRTGWQPGQLSLFGWESGPDQDWPLEKKVAAQQELLGVGVDAHPLELSARQVSAAGAITTLEAATRIGQRVTVAGVRQSWRRVKTNRGDWMMFMTLEDLDGLLDVVVWPEAYSRSRAAIGSSSLLLVTGVIESDTRRGEPVMVAEIIASM